MKVTFTDLGYGVMGCDTGEEVILRIKKVAPRLSSTGKNYHKVEPCKVRLGADTVSIQVYGPGPTGKAKAKPSAELDL